MKSEYKLSTIFFLSIIFINCTQHKQMSYSGVAFLKTRYFDSTKNLWQRPDITPDITIWFIDSLFIQEGKTLFLTEINQQQFYNDSITHYVFGDLKRRWFYEYSSFSDTAIHIDKFTKPDSVNLRSGWNFYRDIPQIPEFVQGKLLDTILNNQPSKYLRFDTTQILDGVVVKRIFINYFLCSKKGTIIQFDRQYSQRMGCPLFRFDYYDSRNKYWISSQIDFLRWQLTQEELSIFKKWSANEKSNPVSTVLNE